jgi:hypothetical protein
LHFLKHQAIFVAIQYQGNDNENKRMLQECWFCPLRPPAPWAAMIAATTSRRFKEQEPVEKTHLLILNFLKTVQMKIVVECACQPPTEDVGSNEDIER